MAAFLGQVGGGEVHRDVLAGQGEAQAREGAAHPFAAFRHCLVAQADHGEIVGAVGDLDLDLHPPRLDPLERQGDNPRGHSALHSRLR